MRRRQVTPRPGRDGNWQAGRLDLRDVRARRGDAARRTGRKRAGSPWIRNPALAQVQARSDFLGIPDHTALAAMSSASRSTTSRVNWQVVRWRWREESLKAN